MKYMPLHAPLTEPKSSKVATRSTMLISSPGHKCQICVDQRETSVTFTLSSPLAHLFAHAGKRAIAPSYAKFLFVQLSSRGRVIDALILQASSDEDRLVTLCQTSVSWSHREGGKAGMIITIEMPKMGGFFLRWRRVRTRSSWGRFSG